MDPNKPQQKMLAKLEQIGELEDVSVRGDVILRLADMRLRIEETDVCATSTVSRPTRTRAATLA